MAYRRSAGRKSARSVSRAPARSRRSSGVRRAAPKRSAARGRRTVSRRSAPRQQQLKIVVEMAQAPTMARPETAGAVEHLAVEKSKGRAKF